MCVLCVFCVRSRVRGGDGPGTLGTWRGESFQNSFCGPEVLNPPEVGGKGAKAWSDSGSFT